MTACDYLMMQYYTLLHRMMSILVDDGVQKLEIVYNIFTV